MSSTEPVIAAAIATTASVTSAAPGAGAVATAATAISATASAASSKTADENSLLKQRLDLASVAIEAVNKELPYGATNKECSGELFEKFRRLFFVLPSPFRTLEPDCATTTPPPQWSLNEKRDIVNRTIKILEQYNIEGFSVEEYPKFRANIATILMANLFRKELELWLKSPEDAFESTVRFNRIHRLFKVGNCGSQRAIAIEYLLKNHRENPALYPLQAVSVSVAGYSSLQGAHQVFFMGFAGDISNGVFGDSWVGAGFPLTELPRYLPEYLYSTKDPFSESTSETLRVSLKVTMTIGSKEEADKLLQTIDPKIASEDLGFTEKEIDEWIEAIYAICTRPKNNAKPSWSVLPPPQELFKVIRIYKMSDLSALMDSLLKAKSNESIAIANTSTTAAQTFTPLKDAQKQDGKSQTEALTLAKHETNMSSAGQQIAMGAASASATGTAAVVTNASVVGATAAAGLTTAPAATTNATAKVNANPNGTNSQSKKLGARNNGWGCSIQ